MHSSDNHRHCFLLKGSTNEVLSYFLRLSEHVSTPLICAYDVSAYDALMDKSKPFSTRTFKRVRQELGSTHDAVLVDITQGISASALAILSGTVRGNGLFAIALPDKDWLSLADQDLARYLPWPYEPEQVDSSFKRFFLSRLNNEASPFSLFDHNAFQALPALAPVEQNTPLTEEQANAQSCLLSQKAQSYVLIAPRGRGKSTLLGDTIAKLLLTGKSVAITAPNQEAITALKTRFERVTHEANFTQDLPFFAPDAVLTDSRQWDYLFVDEAAMIPVSMLMALNQKAEHCVFSTTDYGYEGAGKGFGIRFCRYLDKHHAPLKQLLLQQPIRWGENDPLENWINDCFFLGAPTKPTLQREKPQEALQAVAFNCPSVSYEYQQITGQEWFKHTELLANTFQLLVSAHYQTSPDNLRWILDDPSVFTFLSLKENTLKSVAVITSEGELPKALSDEVMQGTRRPRGHLIPQSLLAHEGIETAGQYRYWRISRIATIEASQRQNYASQLLTQIEITATQQHLDFLSTSFAATSETLNFWQKNGFICVRLGTSKDQSSGSYSIMMLKPLHKKARDTVLLWHQYYLANLTINLPRDYRDIEKNIAKKLSHCVMVKEKLSAEIQIKKDLQDLALFVNHHRPYPTIRAQLTRLVKASIEKKQRQTTHKHYLLLNAVVNEPSTEINVNSFGLTKKQVEKRLKSIVRALLLLE